MSVQAMAWALQRARMGDLSAPQNHLLLVLANYADREGCDAFPGQATLATETGMTVRGVRNILQQLEELGVIRKGNQAITAAKNYPFGQRPVVWDLPMMQMELPLQDAAKTTEPRNVVPPRNTVPPRNQMSRTPEPRSHDPSITITPPSLRSGGDAPTEKPALTTPTPATPVTDAKPDRAKCGTRLPEDWQPTGDELQFAVGLGVDGRWEAEKFRDFWLSVAGAKGRKQDWTRTWQNWVRRAAEDLNRNRSRDRETPRRSLAERAADSHRFADEHDRGFG